jgi:excisionase family DNA binding protein
MVQYYSLEEAARMLGVNTEELKKMAQRNEIRSFSDRGSMRFRAQEIEELARQRGRGSDPELQIVEPPSSGKGRKAQTEDVFDFQLSSDDQVEIGQELAAKSGSGSGKKSDKSNRPGPKSPPPKPGSDSDVRLVAEGSDLDFEVAEDSKKRRPSSQPDSGVRILPLEVQSDSDVKIVPESQEDSNVVIGGQSKKSGSDSDIRLVPDQPTGSSGSGLRKGKAAPEHVTEEIDLDAEEAELRKTESSRNLGKSPKTVKPKKTGLPTESPFELSDPKLSKPKAEGKKKETDTSSDFELTPAAAADQSPLELGSDEIPLQADDEEVHLGEVAAGQGDSGINLKDPADSGISLEQGGEEESLEFEGSAQAPSTPKPGPIAVKNESDSEFELSTDAKATSESHKAAKAEVDSDSEFELTLDDSGDLLPLDEEAPARAAEGEEDIFETDFEVPALDEDSGSEAVALDESDTDLESSDFDLALDEQDAASDEEIGSEVVALEDEENADAGASTVARPRKKPTKKAARVADEIEEEIAEEDEEEAPTRRAAVAAAPANWGVLPALVMMPCVVVMFFVSIMGFEMIRGMWGYRQGTPVAAPVTKSVANGIFQQNVP